MSSEIETIFRDTAWPIFQDYMEESVTRRIKGDSASTESVDAIVVRDSAAAGRGLGATVTANEDGTYEDTLYLIEVAADQDVDVHDRYVIDGMVFDVIGPPAAKDAASQTLVLRNRRTRLKKRPRLQE